MRCLRITLGLVMLKKKKIKKKLNFFFLNPIDKYLASKRLPWKFCLQRDCL